MSIVRSLDGVGDWRFGKGRNDYLTNDAAIVQNVATRLRSFLGDCFFALDAGIDWFTFLGSKNKLALELAVRATILNTSGVTGIISLTLTLNPVSRRISLQYTINTIFTAALNLPPITSSSFYLLTESGDILITEGGDRLVAE